MKKHYTIVIYFFISLKGFSQDSLKIRDIDSIVAVNENRVSTIFQKIGKSKIETMHGRNPKKNADVYRYTDSNVLLSATFAAYSISDTAIIINLYFDSGNLIKAKTVYFGSDNKRSEYNYYYHNNQLINKEAEMSGIHRSDFYVERAARLRRQLKKRPIKFPS
jgi:hypothetical protein